ncbi:PREDICTED: WAT1-related protein At2g39510-like [Tarenaya hassleriana]|uniref:WAT1-related protein At2g39510-like n=1 Tax=Tarenaya hassleriana TaxID=28532 RepID=UPI00053C82A4|nr:PREDICTED: WAT1-related protein At2g39510-like [Tarenaya hassleriana]
MERGFVGTLKTWKPFLLVIFLQFGSAGLSIIAKSALNNGMSPHVLVSYRYIVATLVISPFAFFLDRKVRPKMTLPVLFKILMLGLLEPTIDQNLYYTGMRYTSATFTAAMSNVLPAFAFLMAWLFRLENVNIRKTQGQAKIFGTIVTVGGAMLMTLVRGPLVPLPWNTNPDIIDREAPNPEIENQPLKGAILIVVGSICWAGFINLQAITLKSYPFELSLTAYICLMGAIEGTLAAFLIERGNPAAWSVQFDSKLLAAVYSGVICSGIAYYVQGLIMKTRGPVFVTAFSPLKMVIVAILGSFVLAEVFFLGTVLGAIVIVLGLYSVLWGKSKDEPAPFSDMDNELPLGRIQQVESVSSEARPQVKEISDIYLICELDI